MNNPPEGYRIIVLPRQGLWFGRVWFDGAYIEETPFLYTHPEEAEAEAIKLAWVEARNNLNE